METKKIIESLRCCLNPDTCKGCAYNSKDKDYSCSDMLLRIAAERLEELEKQDDVLHEDNSHLLDRIASYECRIAELEKQLSEQHSGWISVEDRLPGTRDNVLAYDINDVGIIYIAFYFDGLWRQDDIPHVGVDTITHWMPLPEPPKPKVPTFKDVFLDKFPKAMKRSVGNPISCRNNIFGSYIGDCMVNCGKGTCFECWNQPYFEEEGESDA